MTVKDSLQFEKEVVLHARKHPAPGKTEPQEARDLSQNDSLVLQVSAKILTPAP